MKLNIDNKLPATYIDRTWIQVMLQNLVSNAAKYSKSGQSVAVTMACENNEIKIAVKDNGCGIPQAQQSKY